MSNIISKERLVEILKHRCNIMANPQCGKTNLNKIILAEFVKQQLPVQIRLYDTCQVYRHNFLSAFKLQEINDITTQVYQNPENILFDIEYEDVNRIMQFIGNDILFAYSNNRLRKKSTTDGKLHDWILFSIEEAQGSFDRYLFSRANGKIWLKLISEGSNFGLSFTFIGQRLADITTGAVERSTVYFIGKTTGDNNINKLKRLLGADAKDKHGNPIWEKAKTLELGQFIYWNGSEAWQFNCPLFEDLYPNQKPQLVSQPKQERWLKLF